MKTCDFCGEKIISSDGDFSIKPDSLKDINATLMSENPDIGDREIVFDISIANLPQDVDICLHCLQFAIVRASDISVEVNDATPPALSRENVEKKRKKKQ